MVIQCANMSAVYPVFTAPYFQRGHGQIGFGVPEFWRRTVKPLLKRVGIKALRHGTKLGARVAHDVARGKKISESLKRRAQQTIKELAQEQIDKGDGPPQKRPYVRKKPTRSNQTRVKDVFD